MKLSRLVKKMSFVKTEMHITVNSKTSLFFCPNFDCLMMYLFQPSYIQASAEPTRHQPDILRDDDEQKMNLENEIIQSFMLVIVSLCNHLISSFYFIEISAMQFHF